MAQTGMLLGIMLQLVYAVMASWTAYLMNTLYMEHVNRQERAKALATHPAHPNDRYAMHTLWHWAQLLAAVTVGANAGCSKLMFHLSMGCTHDNVITLQIMSSAGDMHQFAAYWTVYKCSMSATSAL